MRRTAEEAEATRQDILDAARRLFTEHGYADTPTTAIVDAAGVTRGALYHHFADKAALFHEVFVALETELNDTVLAAATAAGPDLRAAFRAGARALLDFATGDTYRQIAVADAPAVLGMRQWHEIDTDIGMRSLQAMLEAFHAEGLLTEPPTHTRTVLLFGALTQAALELGRGRGTTDVDDVVREYERLVLDR